MRSRYPTEAKKVAEGRSRLSVENEMRSTFPKLRRRLRLEIEDAESKAGDRSRLPNLREGWALHATELTKELLLGDVWLSGPKGKRG